jgi:PRC-barrel domain
MAEPATAAGSPPPLHEALGWIGFRVDDMNSDRVARVESIYVDGKSGAPVWVLVKVGRFGKVTAVPYADCAEGAKRIWIAHSRKAIRGAPALAAGQPLTREQELELCEYFWILPDRGRAAEIASRPAEAETAKPADSA